MNGIDKIPNWEILWSHIVHEEIRRNIMDGVSSWTEDEKKISLAFKGKKSKGKLA